MYFEFSLQHYTLRIGVCTLRNCVKWYHGGEAGRGCRWERLCRCHNVADFHGATAGKHAPIDGSTWHTASFYPSWEVNIDRQNDKSLLVVYNISHRTISRMSKMCVYRKSFVIWSPAVDDASGRCSLLFAVLNWKIYTTSWPSRGTQM